MKHDLKSLLIQTNYLTLFIILISVILLAGCGGVRTEQPFASTSKPTSALAPVTMVPASNSAATPAPAHFNLSEDLTVRQIQEGVFVITHAFPWPANSMVVEMETSDLVLVDTPYTPEATQTVLEWVETHFGKRYIIAINTGFHVDNLGGNSYLIEAGIPVYGPDLTARLIEERGEQTRAVMLNWLKGSENRHYYETHQKLSYLPPTHAFALAEGLEMQFGEETVQVYYPGPSHSPDNLVVYFPRQKVLFGGCMILAGDKVGHTADADLKAWPDAVQKLAQFDFDVLVPGHGDRLDPGLIEHTLNLLGDIN